MAVSILKTASETVSDSFPIAKYLKGLPDSFQPFSAVVTQKGEMDFSYLKVSSRNYEENESKRGAHCPL